MEKAEFYDDYSINSIIVAVGAVIEDDHGRILLVKHVPERGGFWQGKWICPGGRLELGESIADGIKREVKEETNLEIALAQPLIPFERIVKDGTETALHVVYIDYLARLLSGKLKPATDVGEALWVHKDELWEMWNELHDDTKRLMQLAGYTR
ncbi:MAG: NUDIX domain-containing protein [Chloroflexota bacterium]|nr:NUDIX domain-containing protein [Chloroflexota bacterium]